MPVYEYKCTKGHVYEKTEGFTAPSRQKCVRCGARAQRQISMPAVIFKGPGFYSTDNRKGWTPADSGSDSASTNGASSTESKAETANAD